jgi:hypothetical protein
VTPAQAKQVTIIKTAAFLYNGSAVLRTEWVYHTTIRVTCETQLSGSAESGSKHGQLILFQSLYLCFECLISILMPQGNDITNRERIYLDKDEIEYLTANQGRGTLTKQTRKMII